jgi:hypothetical protein
MWRLERTGEGWLTLIGRYVVGLTACLVPIGLAFTAATFPGEIGDPQAGLPGFRRPRGSRQSGVEKNSERGQRGALTMHPACVPRPSRRALRAVLRIKRWFRKIRHDLRAWQLMARTDFLADHRLRSSLDQRSAMPLLNPLALLDSRQSDTALFVATGTRRLLWRLNFSASPNCRCSRDRAPTSSRSQWTPRFLSSRSNPPSPISVPTPNGRTIETIATGFFSRSPRPCHPSLPLPRRSKLIRLPRYTVYSNLHLLRGRLSEHEAATVAGFWGLTFVRIRQEFIPTRRACIS